MGDGLGALGTRRSAYGLQRNVVENAIAVRRIEPKVAERSPIGIPAHVTEGESAPVLCSDPGPRKSVCSSQRCSLARERSQGSIPPQRRNDRVPPRRRVRSRALGPVDVRKRGTLKFRRDREGRLRPRKRQQRQQTEHHPSPQGRSVQFVAKSASNNRGSTRANRIIHFRISHSHRETPRTAANLPWSQPVL